LEGVHVSRFARFVQALEGYSTAVVGILEDYHGFRKKQTVEWTKDVFNSPLFESQGAACMDVN